MNYFKTEHHLENCRNAQLKAKEANRLARLKRIEEYNKSPKLCASCQNPIDYAKTSNKYCGHSCAARIRNLGRKRTEEEKKKCSETHKRNFESSGKIRKTRKIRNSVKFVVATKDKNCLICNNVFQARYPYRAKMCSDSCRSIQAKERIKDCINRGEHKGWTSRKNKTPSFPERFFISLFEARGISYLHEEKIGKYFGDFVIGKNVLEIDGKQHELPERKLKDTEKDKFLVENGYKVTRIKWRNCKKYYKELVAEFEKFLASIK